MNDKVSDERLAGLIAYYEEVDCGNGELDALRELQALRAQGEDAARYRWLKENADTDWATHYVYMELAVEEWDETIDEAIADAAREAAHKGEKP